VFFTVHFFGSAAQQKGKRDALQLVGYDIRYDESYFQKCEIAPPRFVTVNL